MYSRKYVVQIEYLRGIHSHIKLEVYILLSLVRSLWIYIVRTLNESSYEGSHWLSIIMAGSSRTDLCDLNQQRQCFAGSSVEASTACSRQQGLALRSRLRFAIIALLACLVAVTAKFFLCVCVEVFCFRWWALPGGGFQRGVGFS